MTDAAERKITQYVEYCDDEDEPGGHGTHVVGSIVGAATAALGGVDGAATLYEETTEVGTLAADEAAYDGMAPGAKVAFFDVGDATGALYTPDDLATELFPPAAAAGAHLHSDSWGTDYNGNTTRAPPRLVRSRRLGSSFFSLSRVDTTTAAGCDARDGRFPRLARRSSLPSAHLLASLAFVSLLSSRRRVVASS